MKDNFKKIKLIKKIISLYIKHKLGITSPQTCILLITLKCNLSCLICPFCGKYGMFKNKINLYKKNEMTTQEVKYIINEISEIGVSRLVFSGGEPLLRNDLKELTTFAHQKGIQTSLITNGTLLTEESAKSLQNCFDIISVSIHGLEKIDDKIKRIKGAFKKSVNGLKLLKKYSNAKVGINFVVNKYNYHQIEDILNFAKENCDFIKYIPVNYFAQFFIKKENSIKVMEKLIELKEKNKNFIINEGDFFKFFPQHFIKEKISLKCRIFEFNFMIWPNGELSGCCSFPLSLGNILQSDIKKLIQEGKSKKKDIQRECLKRNILSSANCGEDYIDFKNYFKHILFD